jgi:hypothetical protein
MQTILADEALQALPYQYQTAVRVLLLLLQLFGLFLAHVKTTHE